MKPDLIRYAKDRITTVMHQRLNRLIQQCTTSPKEPTDAELMEAVRYGDAELKRTAKLDMTLREAFNFTHIKPVAVLDKEKLEKLAAPVRAEAAKALDSIMLGDDAEALVAIRQFIGNE